MGRLLKILHTLWMVAVRVLLGLSIVIVVLLFISLSVAAPDIGKEWWLLILVSIVLVLVLFGLIDLWQKYK